MSLSPRQRSGTTRKATARLCHTPTPRRPATLPTGPRRPATLPLGQGAGETAPRGPPPPSAGPGGPGCAGPGRLRLCVPGVWTTATVMRGPGTAAQKPPLVLAQGLERFRPRSHFTMKT